MKTRIKYNIISLFSLDTSAWPAYKVLGIGANKYQNFMRWLYWPFLGVINMFDVPYTESKGPTKCFR